MTRRRLLQGVGTLTAVGGFVGLSQPPIRVAANPSPEGAVTLFQQPDTWDAPPVEGVHLTYGADPSTQMVVSWIPRRRCGSQGSSSGRRRAGSVIRCRRGPGPILMSIPLFDQYGVDLVLCGHEHHYERSLPVRGVDASSLTLIPQPVPTNGPVVDSSQGTVHMLIGGGGTSVPSNTFLFDQPECKVTVGATPPDSSGRRQPVYVRETAIWSAFRDNNNPYGFASFDVDPGLFPRRHDPDHRYLLRRPRRWCYKPCRSGHAPTPAIRHSASPLNTAHCQTYK